LKKRGVNNVVRFIGAEAEATEANSFAAEINIEELNRNTSPDRNHILAEIMQAGVNL
jgi:hypothetical protein